jgi:large subunit ribosomal protein L5
LAEKKPVAPAKKKAVVKKQDAKAPAPAAKKKIVAEKKVEAAKVPVSEPKVVTEKKEVKKKTAPVVAKKVEEKVVPKEKASEPAVAPAKETPAAEQKTAEKVAEPKTVPVKKEKVAEVAAPVVEKKPVAETKVEPKISKKPRKEWAGNPMLMPIIEKVTVNMSVGQSGRPLTQAETILKTLTNQKPSKRKAKKTIREFGIRKGESIACLVTLRGEQAKEFLRKAFYAVENKLSKYCFDRQGNFAFGIKEHINIPGTKYSPELGIHGMDVAVSLGRAGYRVKRRHRAKSKIGKDHMLTAKEAILFIKDEFDVEIA